MKYSYIANSEKHSVIVTKTGSVIEVRRGELTGDALEAAGRHTWGSETEWRAQLPAGAAVTDTSASPRKSYTKEPTTRTQKVAAACRPHVLRSNLHVKCSERAEIEMEIKRATMWLNKYEKGYMIIGNKKWLIPENKHRQDMLDQFKNRIANAEKQLAANPSTELRYVTTGPSVAFIEQEDRMYPLYINRTYNLLKYKNEAGTLVDAPAGATAWLPVQHGDKKLMLKKIMLE